MRRGAPRRSSRARDPRLRPVRRGSPGSSRRAPGRNRRRRSRPLHPLDERVEERAIERLACELVAELLAIAARDPRVAADQLAGTWIATARLACRGRSGRAARGGTAPSRRASRSPTRRRAAGATAATRRPAARRRRRRARGPWSRRSRSRTSRSTESHRASRAARRSARSQSRCTVVASVSARRSRPERASAMRNRSARGLAVVVEQAPPQLAVGIAHGLGELERAAEIQAPHVDVTIGAFVDEEVAGVRIRVEQADARADCPTPRDRCRARLGGAARPTRPRRSGTVRPGARVIVSTRPVDSSSITRGTRSTGSSAHAAANALLARGFGAIVELAAHRFAQHRDAAIVERVAELGAREPAHERRRRRDRRAATRRRPGTGP